MRRRVLAFRAPAPPTSLGTFGADPGLDTIVGTALQTSPAARHGSMMRLHDELTAWLAWSRWARK